MKRLLFTFCISLTVLTAGAQKIYFVYLQTENRQPFYIKLGDRILSSSATGYVILPKLKDSTYKISVGFPKNKWPEQNFSLEMKGKDHGYLLKNFDDGSWGLFDLQTMTIQIAPPAETGRKEYGDVSRFTEVLAKAANDPSLREKPALAKAEENAQPVVAQPAVLTETETVKNPPPVPVTPVIEEKQAIREEVIAPVAVDYRRSVVTKKSESSTTRGVGILFIDEYADGKKDTISILIPDTKQNAVKEPSQDKRNFLDFETSSSSGAQRLPFKVALADGSEEKSAPALRKSSAIKEQRYAYRISNRLP